MIPFRWLCYSLIILVAISYAVEPVDDLPTDSLPRIAPIPNAPAEIKDIEGKVKTVYGTDGRPINQSENSKGYHRVSGSCKLKGTGVDTVSLNSSIADGRQDITFIGQSTYFGQAWSLSSANGNTYRVIPIGGNKFEIRSSSSTDTNTVNFQVEGE